MLWRETVNDKQLIDLIALTMHYRNALRKARALLHEYGNPTDALERSDKDAVQLFRERAEQELEFAAKHKIKIYTYTDEEFPYRLSECPDAPLVLYGRGNLQPNGKHMLSVVGTRGATDRGKTFTRQLILDLAAAVPDLTIVSGLAYGIDVAAHMAALEANIPTIVIPGHGLDRIYPSVHRQIAVRTLEQGGILTEYATGTEPERMNFVARDRIIAGLADAVVVVESREKGGSLITAGMAFDYSREVFARPGRPEDIASGGCNRLIRRNMAHMILTADDLIHDMQWERRNNTATQTELVNLFGDLTNEEQLVLNTLHTNEDGVHVNFLVMETGISYPQMIALLMEMEMKDIVHALPGGVYRALK